MGIVITVDDLLWLLEIATGILLAVVTGLRGDS